MQSSRNRQYPCYRYQTCLKPSATCPEEIREKNLWISAKMSISMHYSTHTHTHRGSDLISIDIQTLIEILIAQMHILVVGIFIFLSLFSLLQVFQNSL